MRNRFALLAPALVLLLSAWTHAAGRPATVYTVDDQKLVVNVMDDVLAIRTSCGTVSVPAEDVTVLYPGFPATDAVHKRIEDLIPRLMSANKAQAERDLLAVGRAAVPPLQAVAAGDDPDMAKAAAAVLKTLWPSGVKVPGDGGDILFTKTMQFRGAFTFAGIRTEGSLGKKTLALSDIRLVQFDPGEVPAAGDPPVYGTAKGGKMPELELSMADGARIVGTLDSQVLSVDTRYGKLSVGVKELILVKLGDPDEVETRDMKFQGKLSVTEFGIRTKVGAFKLDRAKVLAVKVLLNEPVPSGVQPPGDAKLQQGVDIFNGKDLKGWKLSGAVTAKIENKVLLFSGRGGALTYEAAGDLKNVYMAVRVKLDAFMPDSNFILTAHQNETGSCYVRFDGKNAALMKWDTKAGGGTVLKSVKCEVRPGEWYVLQFGVLDTLLMVGVNGKPVGEFNMDPKDVPPDGKILLMVTNCDASIRDIQIKVPK